MKTFAEFSVCLMQMRRKESTNIFLTTVGPLCHKKKYCTSDLNRKLENCAQSATGWTQVGTLAQRAMTPVHPNGCGTSKIVFGTLEGIFWDHSGRFLGWRGREVRREGEGGMDGCSAGSFTKDHQADQRKTYLRETIKHSSKGHGA